MNDADSFCMDFDSDRGEDSFKRPDVSLIEPSVLNVYLASALTNVDDATKEESRQLRQILRMTLEGYDYQGVRLKVYDPAEVTPPGSQHSCDEVYVTDHHQTSSADLVIFYVMAPSLGVGMESQIAADCTLPRVVITKRGLPVSRMFLGLFSPTISHIEYSTLVDFESLLADQMVTIVRAAVESAQRRRTHVAEFNADILGERIMRSRLARSMRLSDLARATDIRESWLERLERDETLTPSMTVIQLHRIATVLGVKAGVSATGTPTLCDGESTLELAARQRQSLSQLVEFARTRAKPVNDQRLLFIWNEHVRQQNEEAAESLRHRHADEGIVTVDEWRVRYDERTKQDGQPKLFGDEE